MHPLPEFSVTEYGKPLLLAFIFISLFRLLKEPTRQKVMALGIAGAGATYLNGGFGLWEFAFNALLVWVAFQGLKSYRYSALGWILHTAWDALHHLYGNPILSFDPLSSFGCFIFDPILALWCLKQAQKPVVITSI